MREELLHFIWSAGQFNQNELHTTTGEELKIDLKGTLNTVAGPDFSDARISIGSTNWAGHVEIHVRASEWNQHQHQHDPAYNNVVLHVVFEHDTDIFNQAGDKVPTLELSGRISSNTLKRYDYLKQSHETIPCADHFPDYPKIKFASWLDRLLVERLERKSEAIELIFKYCGEDWLQTFYTCLLSYMGQNHNKLAFEELARVLPFSLLSKYSTNPIQLEALLFGASGLIPIEQKDGYVGKLMREWAFVRDKHGLLAISGQWKFGGVRPDAFPTRRILLVAELIPHIQEMYDQLMQSKPVSFPEHMVIHVFWKHHYSFTSTTSKTLKPNFSAGLKNLLIINAIAPFTFFYGKYTGSQNLVDHAIGLLTDCATESNKHTKQWTQIGYNCKSASDSQAIIELTTQYCMHKNCVLCHVGKTIISKP